MPEPEQYKETRTKYRETHRAERNEYARTHYQDVKDTRLQQIKEWRANNIEKLTAKIKCGCGGKFQYRTKAEHERSRKHQTYLNSIQ